MMLARDKWSDHSNWRNARRISNGLVALALFASLASCNRMVTPPAKQILKDADAKTASGDFLEAISLYERALDGTPSSADIHYRVALLYDDKMNDPLNALHHFKRYLTLTPSGSHANEVKEFMKRDELTLATTLSGDSVLTRAEGARLKNENLTLRKELAERSAQVKAAGANEKSTHNSRAEKTSSSSKHTKPTRRSRVVKNQ